MNLYHVVKNYKETVYYDTDGVVAFALMSRNEEEKVDYYMEVFEAKWNKRYNKWEHGEKDRLQVWINGVLEIVV